MKTRGKPWFFRKKEDGEKPEEKKYGQDSGCRIFR